MDSFQFMTSSLANLVKNLEHFPHTESIKSKYVNLSDDIIRRKGIFPYSYFTSLDVMLEKQLPPIEAFTNDLTDESCPPEDYANPRMRGRS